MKPTPRRHRRSPPVFRRKTDVAVIVTPELWIERLDAAGATRRARLRAASSNPERRSLILLVDEYGGARVLEAVRQAAARRREELTS